MPEIPSSDRRTNTDRNLKALVVNCSARRYNLGAQKCAAWLRAEGYAVDELDGDPGAIQQDYSVVALSVVFSWHAPLALALARRFRTHADIWSGGPGLVALSHWWQTETGGLVATVGLDPRFERQRGPWRMTFASRGCPVGCWFCIVPKIEGRTFTLDYEFAPAPILCDNNLSALPETFQAHILQRYRETGTPLEDANSGFEPRAFDEGTYARWRHQLKGPWRFAYDELSESDDVRRMMAILSRERARRKQVYVLVGHEPVEACYTRARRVLDWGGEPHCQYLRPLNWLGDPATLRHRYDWSDQLGRDFCRYFNRRLWRAIPIWGYRPRQNEAPPFAFLEPAVITLAQQAA